jgi:hypothetical protein
MKMLILSLLYFCSTFASENSLEDTIVYIDELPKKETLLFLGNGQILRTKPGHSFKTSTHYFIKHIDGTVVYSKEIAKIKKLSFQKIFIQFDPTVIGSTQAAREIFNNMKPIQNESQCYNRATVWSFEWFNQQNINSYKSWIFFTRKYIRQYQFKWWFHVAPSLDVEDEGVIKEKIMDKKYASTPLDPRSWTNIFMKNKAPCRRINNYFDYSHYPESADCFILRTNMYYHQPVDIEFYNEFGIARNSFDQIELKNAYEDIAL